MLDAELIRMKAHVLGLNVAQLSALSGFSMKKVSLFLGGTRGLMAVEITRLRNALDDIEQLVQAASPYPLSFRNVELIRDLISKLKSGELTRQQYASAC